MNRAVLTDLPVQNAMLYDDIWPMFTLSTSNINTKGQTHSFVTVECGLRRKRAANCDGSCQWIMTVPHKIQNQSKRRWSRNRFKFPFLQHRESGLWRLLGQDHFSNLDLIGRVVKKSEKNRSKFPFGSWGYVVPKRFAINTGNQSLWQFTFNTHAKRPRQHKFRQAGSFSSTETAADHAQTMRHTNKSRLPPPGERRRNPRGRDQISAHHFKCDQPD